MRRAFCALGRKRLRGTMASDLPTAGDIVSLHTLPGFRFSDVVHDRPRQLKEHGHLRASLNLILAGSYPEKCEHNVQQEFPAGHLIYKPPQQPHSNEFDGRHVRSLVVELAQSQFESLSQEDAAFRKCWQVYDPGASALAQRLYYELLNCDRDSKAIVESLSYELFAASSDIVRYQHTRHSPQWLDRVVEFLYEEFPNAPPIRELAQIAGISPTHFARGFRLATGYTSGEFIRGRRVARALERLERGEASGSQIAADAGFSDESHMIRTVRKAIFGTPGSFRRRLHANSVLFSRTKTH